ncbi:MAG: NTP transferase domain-containing protein [Pseudomonadota bacterium]
MTIQADISAIILAAGLSSRMGEFKPLLPLGEKNVLARVVTLFHQTGITDIRVVVGHRSTELIAVIEKMGAVAIPNPRYETGMLSSIKAGIDTLPAGRNAFFLLPVDIPLVRTRTLIDLLGAWKSGEKKILYPVFSGRRGHPPLISGALRNGILSWEGDGGLRSFLARQEKDAADVPVADEHILFDIDTPENYREALSRLEVYDIPTTRECMAMLETLIGSNTPLFEHCLAVTGVAIHLTQLLNAAGCDIDTRLITASGLLHDLMRMQPDHAEVAAKWLRGVGYDKVADVVASHMNIRVQDEAPLQAQEVIYLADKLVEGKRVVSLTERFGGKQVQFKSKPEASSAVNARFQTALKIKDRFESKTGKSLEAVLSGYSPPAALGKG